MSPCDSGPPRAATGAGRPGALTLNSYSSSTSVEPHHLGRFDATTPLTLTAMGAAPLRGERLAQGRASATPQLH
jgi:hypothetical protein